jgi:hypothetical protein
MVDSDRSIIFGRLEKPNPFTWPVRSRRGLEEAIFPMPENPKNPTTPREHCPRCGDWRSYRPGTLCKTCEAIATAEPAPADGLRASGVCPECGTLSLVKEDLEGSIYEDCPSPFKWRCLRCLYDFESCGNCGAPRLDIHHELGDEFHCERCGSESPGFRDAARKIAERYVSPSRDGLIFLRHFLHPSVQHSRSLKESEDATTRYEESGRHVRHFHAECKRICQAVGVAFSEITNETDGNTVIAPQGDFYQRNRHLIKKCRKLRPIADVLLKNWPVHQTARQVAEALDLTGTTPPRNWENWCAYHDREREKMESQVSRVRHRLRKKLLAASSVGAVNSRSEKIN